MKIFNDNVVDPNNNDKLNDTYDESIGIPPKRSTHRKIPPTYLQDFHITNFNNNTISTKHHI